MVRRPEPIYQASSPQGSAAEQAVLRRGITNVSDDVRDPLVRQSMCRVQAVELYLLTDSLLIDHLRSRRNQHDGCWRLVKHVDTSAQKSRQTQIVVVYPSKELSFGKFEDTLVILARSDVRRIPRVPDSSILCC
jgi:hypothetical protein